MFGRPRRFALLAEGRFAPSDAQTAVSELRRGPGEVAVVMDDVVTAAEVVAALRRVHAPAA